MSVEFLGPDGDEQSPDELLPDRPARTTRRGALLGLGALAVAGVLLAARGSGTGSRPATVSPTPTPVGGYGTGAPDPGSGLLAGSGAGPSAVDTPRPVVLRGHVFRPPPCPVSGDGSLSCTTTAAVPPALVTAVAGLLPDVRTTAALTQELRPATPGTIAGLWSRQYAGRAGATTVRIAVLRGPDPRRQRRTAADDGATASVFAIVRRGLYTVEIEVDAPSGAAPDLAAVQALAADPRLVATS